MLDALWSVLKPLSEMRGQLIKFHKVINSPAATFSGLREEQDMAEVYELT
ncbi:MULTISPECIES: hypothetical protein [unclassified Rhizobium]|nr:MULTISPECIES: hypothetical protein [unclassified Rhizobium]MBX5166017.1 hypothetical protein [Rhizobium sp. NZLR4b]MBX5209441.1 hypothetical protein [Rhizobium sp. NZLR11]